MQVTGGVEVFFKSSIDVGEFPYTVKLSGTGSVQYEIFIEGESDNIITVNFDEE